MNEDLLSLADVDVVGLGVMTAADALRLARERGLDLVEANPKVTPPRCRLLEDAKLRYQQLKAASHRVFLVRSKVVARGPEGAFLVGDLVTGDAMRAGMMAHVPAGHDVFHAVPILSVELVDHGAEQTSELGLRVVGDSPEQAAALEALEGAHLIAITERFG